MTDHVIQPYDYDIIAMDCHILYYNYMIRPCFLCLSLPSHVLFHNHYHEFHDHNCNDDISICNIYISHYNILLSFLLLNIPSYSIHLHLFGRWLCLRRRRRHGGVLRPPGTHSAARPRDDVGQGGSLAWTGWEGHGTAVEVDKDEHENF